MKCDCLNYCGDDPDLETGKVERCKEWKAAQKNEQEFYDGLPELAYDAYCDATGKKSVITGAALPAFKDTPEAVQNAWKKSAYKLAEAVGYRRRYPAIESV